MMSQNRSEFDQFAGDYDAALAQGISVSGEDKNYFARGRIAWLAERMAAGVLTHGIRRILDFGCGTGSAAPFFREFFPNIEQLVGVDISAESLEVARRENAGRGEFRLMSRWTPDGSMDLAFCNGVFHHIPISERAAGIDYVYRALRPGGLFALWENNPWSPGARYVMNRIPFDRDAIMVWPAEARRLLRHAGFEVLRTDYLFIFPRMLKLLRPMERLVTKLPLGTQYMVLGRKS